MAAMAMSQALCPLLAAAMPVNQVDAQAEPAPAGAAGLAQAGSAVAAHARAQLDRAPDDTLPVCSLAPEDDTRLAIEPCRPAPQQRRRRAVPYTIEPMLQPVPGDAHPPGTPPVAPAPAPAPASSAAPSPQNGCDAGGCRDAAGARYSGGVGNAVIGPDGKVCNHNGAWLQCF